VLIGADSADRVLKVPMAVLTQCLRVLMSAYSAYSASADPASPKTSTGWLDRPTALFAACQS
jgi:hypothetical protein